MSRLTQRSSLGERQEVVYPKTPTRSVNEGEVDRRSRSHFWLVGGRQFFPLALAMVSLLCLSRFGSQVLGQDAAVVDAQAKLPMLTTPYGEVAIFPADNAWNRNVSHLKLHAKSEAWLQSVGLDKPLHPDFGTVWKGVPNGIPFVAVSPTQVKSAVQFEYSDESDVGPYPIPPNPPIEGGSHAPADADRHVLMIDAKNKKLYELYQVHSLPGGKWKAGSGAIFDLSSNALRPAGWTSADAAGLPIFPGLARYDEIVELGKLQHALRFTVKRTQRAYVLPARHFASNSTSPNLPPMGMRVRLKASFDTSKFPRLSQVLLQGLKTYGMLLADNGGDWFVSGAPDARWDDDAISTLKRVKVRDFEVVDTGPIVTR